MKIGTCTWGMPAVRLEEAVRFLGGLGFTGVEPTVIPGFTSELDTFDRDRRRQIRHGFDDLGLDMPVVAGHRRGRGDVPAPRRRLPRRESRELRSLQVVAGLMIKPREVNDAFHRPHTAGRGAHTTGHHRP